MSQGEAKERRVAESVTELDLEIVIVRHGDQKAPNPKLQTPNKSQIPSSERIHRLEATSFGVGVWSFSGALSLEFGAFIRWVLGKRAGEAVLFRQEQVAGQMD